MKTINLLLLIGTFLLLTACGGKHLDTRSGVIDGSSIQTLKLNIPEINKIDGSEITFDINRYDFSSKIQSFSGVAPEKMNGRSAIRHIRGIKVSKKRNQYNINYTNTEYYVKTGSRHGTNVKFILSSAINGNNVEFTLLPNYEIHPMSNIVGSEIAPLAPIANLKADVNKIVSKLSTILITFNKQYNLEGEINSKYSSESTYANFGRILGKYDWSQDKTNTTTIKKENTFNLIHKNRKNPLNIEVYPYRDGSKVKYSASLRYQIDSKGNITLAKNEIDDLRETIIKVAND